MIEYNLNCRTAARFRLLTANVPRDHVDKRPLHIRPRLEKFAGGVEDDHADHVVFILEESGRWRIPLFKPGTNLLITAINEHLVCICD